MRVYQTTNYKQFELINCNRPVDYNRVEHMRKDIRKKNLSEAYPLTVNSKEHSKKLYGTSGKTHAIIDGQHRFLSLMKEGKKIYYCINDDIDIVDIPRAASLQKSWKMTDYIHHYSSPTNKRDALQPYLLLQSYMDRNKFPTSTTLTILCGDRSTHVTDKLKHGELKISRNWTVANNFADAVHNVGKYIPFNKQARFLEAFLKAFLNKNYSHDRFMAKLEYLSTKMKRCSDSYSHLEQIEYVYNYNSSDKVKLNTFERNLTS